MSLEHSWQSPPDHTTGGCSERPPQGCNRPGVMLVPHSPLPALTCSVAGHWRMYFLRQSPVVKNLWLAVQGDLPGLKLQRC